MKCENLYYFTLGDNHDWLDQSFSWLKQKLSIKGMECLSVKVYVQHWKQHNASCHRQLLCSKDFSNKGEMQTNVTVTISFIGTFCWIFFMDISSYGFKITFVILISHQKIRKSNFENKASTYICILSGIWVIKAYTIKPFLFHLSFPYTDLAR